MSQVWLSGLRQGSGTISNLQAGRPKNISWGDIPVVAEIWEFISHVQYGTIWGQFMFLHESDKARRFWMNARFSFSQSPFEAGCWGMEKWTSTPSALNAVW